MSSLLADRGRRPAAAAVVAVVAMSRSYCFFAQAETISCIRLAAAAGVDLALQQLALHG